MRINIPSLYFVRYDLQQHNGPTGILCFGSLQLQSIKWKNCQSSGMGGKLASNILREPKL